MGEKSGWQLSDNAPEWYERYVVPYILGPWTPILLQMAALQRGERVLDLACGTGVVARLAAQKVGPTGKVTGLDLNTRMLAFARELPPSPGALITWTEGNALAMDFQDASFDVILCQQGLQFFPEKLTALREMYRVLVPGGRVLLSVWKTVSPYSAAVGTALERYVGVEAAVRYRTARVVLDAEELRSLLVAAGFVDIHIYPSAMTVRLPPVEAFVLDHLASTPVAGAVAALSEEVRAALAKEVSMVLQSYADSEGVSVPDETSIAMAHK